MTTTYGIRVIHKGRQGDVQLLRQAVAKEVNELGLHRTVTVAVSESAPTDDAPHVAVYLGDREARDDDETIGIVREELKRGVTIFPVVFDLSNFAIDVPEELSFANGIVWNDATTLRRLIRVLLEDLGIEDRSRRVFISHRREDGLAAAEQLHDELTHKGFRPFIDRFAIREGANFQRELADALEDHAFLLLLETPQAHTSDWVFDEVEYALSHTMGILIARWPGDIVDVPGSPGLPRMRIQEEELLVDEHDFDVFTEAGLDRLVQEIESAHAYGLVRRRRMLMKSIEESATAAGVDSCVALRGWRLLVTSTNGVQLIATTPRLPTARDLQVVDEGSNELPTSVPGLLVHSARRLPDNLKSHLEWVAGPRKLSMIPENAIGSWW